MGALTSLISTASYFNLEDRSFLWGAKWWRDWIFGPLWQRVPPLLGCMECGWYGSVCMFRCADTILLWKWLKMDVGKSKIVWSGN